MTQENTLKEFEGRGVKLRYYTYGIITPRLQKDINIYNKVVNAHLKSLHECYTSWSYQKENAFYKCFDDFSNLLYRLQLAKVQIYDYNYGIMSYNTFMFTFGGYIRTLDKNGIVTTYVIYNSPSKSILYIC